MTCGYTEIYSSFGFISLNIGVRVELVHLRGDVLLLLVPYLYTLVYNLFLYILSFDVSFRIIYILALYITRDVSDVITVRSDVDSVSRNLWSYVSDFRLFVKIFGDSSYSYSVYLLVTIYIDLFSCSCGEWRLTWVLFSYLIRIF